MLLYSCLFKVVRGNLDYMEIAPLFAAFDRRYYQKLLPCHLHEVLTMPQKAIDIFEKGAFVCNIINSNGMHSVVLDEVHGMLVKTSKQPYLDHPKSIFGQSTLLLSQALKVLYGDSSHASRVEENVQAM